MTTLLLVTVCGLIGFVLGWWVRNDAQIEPEDVADMTLFEVQAWLADAADVPVSITSHLLRTLRTRPDILRRLETIPVKGLTGVELSAAEDFLP